MPPSRCRFYSETVNTQGWAAPRAWVAGVAVALLAGAAGCASVSVRDEHRLPASQPTSRPERFFVRDFTSAPGVFEVGRRGRELAGFRAEKARALSHRLIDELRGEVAPAWRLPEGVEPGEPGWLVEGEMRSVRSGNPFLRILVGFGAGRSMFETTVRVAAWDGRAASPPFLFFRTTGGSGASPGLVAALVDTPVSVPFLASGPLAAPFAVYSVSNKVHTESVKRGVDDDTERTARMIAAALADYMLARGFLEPGDRPRVKRDWTAVYHTPNNFRHWADEHLPANFPPPDHSHPGR